MHHCRLICLAAALAVPLLAADWKAAGVTSQGNRVSISDVKGGGDVRSGWIRIVYKEPMKTANGVVTSSRAKVRVNCKEMSIAADETIMYSDESANEVVTRKKLKDDPFKKEPEGGFGAVAVAAMCAGR